MLPVGRFPQEDAGLLPGLYAGEGGRQGVQDAVTLHPLLAGGREAGRPPQLGRQLSQEGVLPGRGGVQGGHLQAPSRLGGPQHVLLVCGGAEGERGRGEARVGLGHVQHHYQEGGVTWESACGAWEGGEREEWKFSWYAASSCRSRGSCAYRGAARSSLAASPDRKPLGRCSCWSRGSACLEAVATWMVGEYYLDGRRWSVTCCLQRVVEEASPVVKQTATASSPTTAIVHKSRLWLIISGG